ncbi:Pherokine 3 [Carabus blaptoides fortunei]
MCVEIEEEEKQKDKDAAAHAQWLKIREERKLEVERVFRPINKVSTPVSTTQKRKVSDLLDIPMTVESSDEIPPTQEPPKPALSPLLTSLLKTPSHAPNVTSSILHSAITNQRGSSPTIASLLNTTASVPVSPSLQQLVTTAISQEPVTSIPPLITLTSSSKSSVSPAPPIEVINTDEIKQEIDENSTSETSKSETNTETNETCCEVEKETIKEEPIPNEETESNTDTAIVKSEDETTVESSENADADVVKNEEQENTVADETAQEQIDVYDFDNNSKTSSEEIIKDSGTDVTHDTEGDNTNDENIEQTESDSVNVEIKAEPMSPTDTKAKGKDLQPGSVEIVEVVVMEDDDSDKEMNKKVSELKRDIIRDKAKERDQSVSGGDAIYSHTETATEENPIVKKETTVYDEYDFDDPKKPEEKPEKKSHTDSNVDIDAPEFSRKSTFTPEYTEAFFDDMAIEVTKQEKSGKAKRDYSRTKKKEEKDIDILLAVEKAVNASLEESEIMEETGSEKDSQDSDKKSDSSKTKILKDTNERSNSPWTEEEEVLPKTRRRLSATPATPSDSIPNSPASGTAVFDDDLTVVNSKVYLSLSNIRPCTKEGRQLKQELPDAIETRCAKCSEAQKKIIRKACKHIIERKPDEWKLLVNKYDPTGEHQEAFQKFLNEE